MEVTVIVDGERMAAEGCPSFCRSVEIMRWKRGSAAVAATQRARESRGVGCVKEDRVIS